MKRLVLGFLLGGLLLGCNSATNPSPNPNPTPPTGNLPACSQVSFNASGTGLNSSSFLQAINKVRATPCTCANQSYPNPVAPVAWSPKLEAAATAHSQDMQKNNFFSHTGSDGSSAGTRISRTGYAWSTWGENLSGGDRVMDDAIRGWLYSPYGHCEAIKSASFTEIGAGLVMGQPGNAYVTYWTLDFAKPK